MRTAIPALFLLGCLVGCGQSDDDAFSPDPLVETPDSAQDVDMDPSEDQDQEQDLAQEPADQGPPRPPEVLMFTFWRRDSACQVNNCITEFRIGVRAGSFERLRGGVGLGANQLDWMEHLRAQDIINTDLVRDTMKMDAGWGCPEAAPNSDPTYGFEAALLENGRERRWYQTVTGCVQSQEREQADAIIDFVRELQQRYYPER